MKSAEANGRGKDEAESSPVGVQQKNGTPSSWACQFCTFLHVSPSKEHFLACEICGASREEVRPTRIEYRSISSSSPRQAACPSSSFTTPGSTDQATPNNNTTTNNNNNNNNNNSNSNSNNKSLGSLRAPTEKDIRGPRKRHKALDAPPPMMDYLIVLDFE
jgi:hypothetical protein